MANPNKSVWDIELDASELIASAKTSKQALSSLGEEIAKGSKNLREMKAALGRLKGANLEDKAAVQNLQAAYDKKRQAVAQMQAQYSALGGKLSGIRTQTKQVAKETDFLGLALGATGSRFGGLYLSLKSLGGVLPSIASKAQALKLGMLALAAGAATAALKLTALTVAAADSAASEKIALEALTKRFSWWGIAAGNADKMSAAIDQVTGSVAIARNEVISYNESLYNAGLRGENLSRVLRTVATVASVDKREASRVQGLATAIARSGGDVSGYLARIENRYAGLLERQLTTSAGMAIRLKNNLDSLFGGAADISGLQKAKLKLVELFNTTKGEGRALQRIIGNIVQPLIDGFTAAAEHARSFYLGALLGFLRLEYVTIKIRQALKQTFGFDFSTGVKWLHADTFKVAEVAVYSLSAALLILGANAAIAFAPYIAGAAAAYAGIKLAVGAIKSIGPYIDALRNGDWVNVGTAIVDGIVDGLIAAGARLHKTLTDLATGAIGAFKAVFQIQSPSKVFRGFGEMTVAGYEQGIDANRVTKAMADIQVKPPAPPRQSASTGAVSNSVTVENVHVTVAVNGPGEDAARTGKRAADSFVRELTAALRVANDSMAGGAV